MQSDQEPNKLIAEHTSDMAAVEVYPQEKVSLLEEELVVNRSKQKAGEVVVRKVVETRWVKVPVRREKLIVEESDSRRKLAEIDISRGEVDGVELAQSNGVNQDLAAVGEFVSAKAASDILGAIALSKLPGCRRIRVEIETATAEQKQKYQDLLQSARGSKS